MEPRLWVGGKKKRDLEWVEIKYGLWVSEKQYEIWSGGDDLSLDEGEA